MYLRVPLSGYLFCTLCVPFMYNETLVYLSMYMLDDLCTIYTYFWRTFWMHFGYILHSFYVFKKGIKITLKSSLLLNTL